MELPLQRFIYHLKDMQTFHSDKRVANSCQKSLIFFPTERNSGCQRIEKYKQIDFHSFCVCVCVLCVYGWFMTISNATGLASHCKCYIKRMHMDDFRRNYKQSMKSSLVSFFRLEFTKRPTYFAFRERKRLFSLIILMGIDIGFL